MDDQTTPGRRLALGVYRVEHRNGGRAIWQRVGTARRDPRAGGYVLSVERPLAAGDHIVVRPLRLDER